MKGDPVADLDQSQAAPADTAGAQWSMPLRLFGLALVLLILGAFAWLFAPVIDVILLGFVFAFIFHAVARYSQRFGSSYEVSTIIIYLLVVLVGITMLLSVGRVLVGQADDLVYSVEVAATAIEDGAPLEGLPDSSAALVYDIGVTELVKVGTSLFSQFAEHLSLGLSSIVGFVGTLVVSLLFAFMLQWGLRASRRSALAWVPGSNQRDLILLLDKLDKTWAGYLIAGIIFASVLALLSFVQFELMSVPYPVLLAILTGVLTLIPSIGGILATLVVFVTCVMLGPTNPVSMDNLTFAVAVAIINGVITQGTYYFVGLPVTGRGVKLPIAVVLIGSMAGLATGSLLVAWLTVPIIATLRTALGYLMSKVNGRDPFPEESIPAGARQGFLSQLLGPATVIPPAPAAAPAETSASGG